MSIADEINRISEQKNIIRDKMRDMGLLSHEEYPSIGGLAWALKNKVRIDTGSTAREVLEGDSITIEAGYYKADVTVSGVTNESADKQKIMSLPDKITPTKSEQPYTVPDGYYGFGSFTVKAIPDAYQDTSDANISIQQESNGIFTSPEVLGNKIVYANGKRVLGGMPKNGTIDKTLDATTGVQIGSDERYLNREFNIPKGYHDGTGYVRIYFDDTKEVTPTKLTQWVEADAGSGTVLGMVKIDKIPDIYQDISKQSLTAFDVLETATFVGYDGKLENGLIKKHGSIDVTIDGLTNTEYSGVSGYYPSVKVKLSNDIETALAAI